MSSGCYRHLLPQRGRARFDTQMTYPRVLRELIHRKIALVAVAGLFALGCGAVPAGPGPTPSPSPPRGIGFDIVATEKERAVTMHAGQTLEVVLHAVPNMNPWTHPVTSNGTVLKPIVDTGATSPIGVSLAAFQAVAPGHAQITASAGAHCPPGAMCPQYLAAYTLDVTVTA